MVEDSHVRRSDAVVRSTHAARDGGSDSHLKARAAALQLMTLGPDEKVHQS